MNSLGQLKGAYLLLSLTVKKFTHILNGDGDVTIIGTVHPFEGETPKGINTPGHIHGHTESECVR